MEWFQKNQEFITFDIDWMIFEISVEVVTNAYPKGNVSQIQAAVLIYAWAIIIDDCFLEGL